jgi:hypothetical protein
MRSVRAVYTKLRDVKYHHLVKLYKKYLKKIPENCKYNIPYNVDGKKEIRLCVLHQPNLDLSKGVYPHLLTICQEPNHCKNCNAFICKYTKKDVQDLFEDELKNEKLKIRKYPDITALEWVLEQSVTGLPPFDSLQKFFFWIKRILNKKLL